MPFIPVPDVVQAELICTWSTQVIETVLHFQPDNPPDPGNMAELGAELVGWWSSDIRPVVPTTLTLTQVKLVDLSTETGLVLNYSTGLPLVGTGASPSLPNNVACVITKRTLLRGRSFRGRIYHPGLMENQVVDNTVSGTTVSGLLGIYGQLRTFSTTSADWNMVVVSRYSNNAPRATGVATFVNSLSCDGTIDSQRRRLPGRGS